MSVRELTADESTVSATLRFLAGGWLTTTTAPSDDQQWLIETADAIDRGCADDACCPLCAEVICDEGCPLHATREALGIWTPRESGGRLVDDSEAKTSDAT